jgi:hypothetical protein
MNSIIGICSETHKEYKAAYKKKRGDVKYALGYEAFKKRLVLGKTITIGNHEFMSQKTFSDWINQESAMLAAHG